MTATCRCGTCSLRWFRCNCPDVWPDERAEPEKTWVFWRNMTRQDVEALMAREAKFWTVERLLRQRKQELMDRCW